MSDSVYDPRCKEIQHHDGVRFAAIINHAGEKIAGGFTEGCLLYTSPSPRDGLLSRMPSSA